jgi:hypothetical protein
MEICFWKTAPGGKPLREFSLSGNDGRRGMGMKKKKAAFRLPEGGT